MIIVIDGPAGSGKSSTARAVADKMDIEYLDSGALYRAVTLIYIEAAPDRDLFFRLLKQKEISFSYRDKKFYVYVEGKDMTDRIRSIQVSENVSEVATMPKVRSYINNLMRNAIKKGIYIAEGRDLGTVVFPDAALKFYMIADVNERARRRLSELKAEDEKITFEKVKKSIKERDQKDSKRAVDPLRKAEDAIEIDTTHTSFEQQVEKICSQIEEIL